MKLKKKTRWIITLLVITILAFTGCTSAPENEIDPKENGSEAPQLENTLINLATTTSTRDSGLLDDLLPIIKEDTGLEVKVIAVGTGKALKMGEDGEADVLLVHAKPSEEQFVADGHGLERFDVMYNDFVIIGPEKDPAKLTENSPKDVVAALQNIFDTKALFISRGDDSGTHKKEKALWGLAGTASEKSESAIPEADWYISAGKGMGAVIQMANEKLAYTMADRATFLKMSEEIDLVVRVEGDELLFNQYGVIAVNPQKNDLINAEGAQVFIDWLLSEKAQNLIREYGVEQYGQPLFVPNAK